MKTLIRKFYNDLKIGDVVEVQQFYGRLTENYFMGTVTNRDGQNIVVEVQGRKINEPVVDGDKIKIRDFEALNPKYADVSFYYAEEL